MRINKLLSRLQRLVADPRLRWAHDPQLWVELFVTANLAILAADIYIAHSVNHFQKTAEYIPLYFSIGAALVLGCAIALRWIWKLQAAWRDMGYLVGWLSVLVGLGGVLYHLESRFFLDKTLKSLTYAAPFAAPLAYTGLGFLLLMNRMVAVRSVEWARWVTIACAWRLLWKLRAFPDGSCIERILRKNRMDSRNLVGIRHWVPHHSGRYLRYAPLSRSLFAGNVHAGVRGCVGILVPYARKYGRAGPQSLRQISEWRAAHGSTIISESSGIGADRAVGSASASARSSHRQVLAGCCLCLGTSRRRSERCRLNRYSHHGIALETQRSHHPLDVLGARTQTGLLLRIHRHRQ